MKEQQLGKYSILEEIGRGGFATVYRAEDTALGREVALKVLDPLLMRDEAFVARFQREARAAARLEHPQIVPIYDVGASAGRLFIAMRLVRGGSLAHTLAEGKRFPWEEMLQILKQVGDALRYAHAEGVIHRDIKPDNILLDERSGAMLSDFGFARLVGTSSMTQSISGGIVGTPAYMAPEIWEDAEATPATDVYALGCVVYEMLTGKPLFGGSTPMAVMRAHDQGAHLPQAWPVDIPQELGAVLGRAIARKPEARYASVAEFLAALEALELAALAERRAAEAARWLEEAQRAHAAREYDAAIAAAEALLALEPEHREGTALLRKAQEQRARQQELAARLAERTAEHERECSALEQTRAALEERAAALEQTIQARKEERARIQKRLEELDQQSREHTQQLRSLEQEREQYEAAFRSAESQRYDLQEAARLLEEGDWQAVARLLVGRAASEARTDVGAGQERTESPSVAVEAVSRTLPETRFSNSKDAEAPESELSGPFQAYVFWVILAVSFGFFACIMFFDNNPGAFWLLAVLAGISLALAMKK